MEDPNILKIRHGGGACATLFGLPFFLAGLFCIVSPWLPNLNWEGGQPPPLYFILPFGSIFALIGGAIIFGRVGVILDAKRRVVTTWWGFLVPFKYTHRSIPRDAFVSITKVRKKNDNSSYWSYEVKIEGDFETVEVESNTEWFPSRTRAEEVAKLLGTSVIDRTQGEETITAAEDLDKPLSQKIKESGAALELPSPPPGHRTRIEIAASGIRLEIPPPGFSPLHLVQVLGLIALYAFMTWFFFASFLEGLDWSTDWMFFVFSALFYVGPGYGVISSIIRDIAFSNIIEADPTTLLVISKRLILTRKRSVRMSQIEEVAVVTGEGESTFGKSLPHKRFVRVVTDGGELNFGQGLALDELSWVNEVLCYLISKAN